MTFRKIDSNSQIIDYLVTLIGKHLDKGQQVMWFLSGGSAIGFEVEVAKQLKGNRGLDGLTVALADERYGPVGHADSNLDKLIQAGFSLPGSTIRPVLVGHDLQTTVKLWTANLESDFSRVDFVVMVAGIGADGHTLGIKPGSPALNSQALAAGYEWTDYTRLTLTAEAIKRVDEILVYAVGQEKASQLLKLKQEVAASEQPAQLLKLGDKVTIFNDQIN